MCGIAGLVNVAGAYSAQAAASLATAMASQMVHRGPDDSGCWIDDDAYCALAHRRLSIIDTTSGGRQPMQSMDGRAVINYNGELYNYQQLRLELAAQGFAFKTETDTEVMLYKLLTGKEKALPHLDGMFALAFFDSTSKELLLARDPFGEKPLYYLHNTEIFAFASELSALSVIPGFDATVSRESLDQYLLLQYVQSPRSIYKNVRKLPPGYYLRLSRDGKIDCRPYFQFSPRADKFENRDLDDLADELEDILLRSIKGRLMSDVPLGLFLSRGVDSSTIAALCTKKLGLEIKTFTIGFPGSETSEHLQAREIAQHLGTNHQERLLETNFVQTAMTIAAKLDEPNGDTSCLPTYLLAEFAREQVTVALSGDGGDELFGGYNKYLSVAKDKKQYGKLPWPVNWDAATAFTDHTFILDPYSVTKLSGHLASGVAELISSIQMDFTREGIPIIDTMRKCDVHMFLPGAVLAKTDRMTMQHSLEVRSPFLSVEVARFAERLAADSLHSDNEGKVVLKHLAKRYLPAEWVTRPKQGFDLPRQLFKDNELLNTTRTFVLQQDAILKQWLGESRLQRFFQSPGNQKRYYALWAMLMLEAWLRTHPAKEEARSAQRSATGVAARHFLSRAIRKVQRHFA